MTADLHQSAKKLFSEICDLPQRDQELRLAGLEAASPDLVREVRSLLSYHSTSSAVIPVTSTPKVRTRSTLSKTYRSRPLLWLKFVLRSMAVAVPVLLTGVLLSYWTSGQIQSALKSGVAQRLTERIDQRLKDFNQWEDKQLSEAVGWSQNPEVVQAVGELVKVAAAIPAEDSKQLQILLSDAKAAETLDQHLSLLAGDSVKYTLWDRRMITLADVQPGRRKEMVGDYVSPAGASILAPVLRGRPQLYLPRQSSFDNPNATASSKEFALSILLPIEDQSGSVVAALMIGGEIMQRKYRELVAAWSTSQLGETYFVSDRGAMLSRSRYADALEKLQLPALSTSNNDVRLVRNPGVDLLAGYEPETIPSAWPPTQLAQQVTAGNNGMSVEGYQNYVGQWVVGAWRWIPQHEVGLALEEHAADAFVVANKVQWAIWGLTGLFALSTAAVALSSIWRLARSNLRELSDVGPYQVQELLGEGGMGRVYLAEHALLCRQSAVKVLSGSSVDYSVISRFEREVQLASQLTHPNTIAIYDFGRNQEGLFYYAMEYIHGAHLGQLSEYAGPLHPGRCIYVLVQLCRALNEAHQVGVVHRDIKPQNIMVCNRGGEPDFVKLFDYGLVKAFAPGVSPTASQTKIVVGTPRFMAPERLSAPWLADPRVDIYSVGALAYFLLTGKLPPLFTSSGQSSSEHPGVETLDLPSGVVEFGELLGMCLSTEPSDRPSSMKSLVEELGVLAERFPWSREDSMVWWSKHEAKLLQLVQSKRKKLVAQLSR